jgi:predicted CoA-binding protein
VLQVPAGHPEKVDLVDCFRKSEEIPSLADDADRDRAQGAVDAARA